jgi:hypothetical protein
MSRTFFQRLFRISHNPNGVPSHNPGAGWDTLRPKSQTILRGISVAFNAIDKTILQGYSDLEILKFGQGARQEADRCARLRESTVRFSEMIMLP